MSAPPQTSPQSMPRMPAAGQIVLLGDSAAETEKLKDLMEFMDAPEVVCGSPSEWQAGLGESRLAALFVSPVLGDAAVVAAVEAVAGIDRNAPVVLCGAGGPDLSAYGWLRLHRLDNPLQLDELGVVLDEVWAAQRPLRHDGAQLGRSSQLIGDSADMRMIRALIGRVAPSQATVLITGASGTGKELIARQIHEQSGRNGEFVAINCGAIPDHLLESELFGHEKGAFTGAHAARAGRFEQAEGGTLFLDEIGDMPTAMQVKLLRVLQERVIERVGGTKGKPVDIRVVAATHRNLQARIEDGSFREDLYYRLSVFPIELSPLRERPDDVEPLVHALIERVAQNCGVRVTLSKCAMAALVAHDWPGNVRELANLVERLAVIRPHGRIKVGDLPRAIAGEMAVEMAGSDDSADAAPDGRATLPASGLDLKEHLSNIERDMIAAALQDAGGVVQQAAKRLGVGRTTLVEKIRRHELRD